MNWLWVIGKMFKLNLDDGKGAKYTRGRLSVEVIETSDKMTRSYALKLERFIKKLSKIKKYQN